MAMLLPAERNRYTDTTKEDRTVETKGGLRERERVREGVGEWWKGGREEILQRKAIAAKSFSSRERHVHVVGVFSAPYPAYKTYSR